MKTAVVSSGEPQMQVRFFTWNIHRNRGLLKKSLEWLRSQGGAFVAGFQEVPVDVTAADVAKIASGVRLVGQSRRVWRDKTRNILMVTSDDIGARATGTYWRDRLLLSRLQFGDTEICCGVAHGPDRINTPAHSPQRISMFTALTTVLHEYADSKDGVVRTVLMGDLNANPFDQEVRSISGLWAVQNKSDLDCTDRRSTGLAETVCRPMYNPMWHSLREEGVQPHGTYFHSQKGDVRWKWVDQVIVSGDLASYVSEPEIPAVLGTFSLTTKNGRPKKDGASDHLPVMLGLNLEELDD